jgi:hypothetical protein
LLPQQVLYIGHRANEFEPFLKQHFAGVKCVSREDFRPVQAKDFDVVLLDWPQVITTHFESYRHCPLGERAEWNKPTVLLGSAGLNLAVAWKLKGGAGCTCLAPVAYGLKTNHEIFKSPIPIDFTTTNVPTPAAFVSELKTSTVDVIPLVEGIRRYDSVINDYPRGWCVYYYEFADMPEVEYFCGGINEKTPRASALWRQGNLLHFGFESSPAQLNATGRALLINAIAYISRFSQDRPIDVTPSVFGDEKIAQSRRRAKNALLGEHPDWSSGLYADATLASFKWRDHAVAEAWFDENGSWLHPGRTNLLEVDAEAKSLGVPFDAPDFLPKTIAALRGEKTKTAAANLLARYAPEGPGQNAAPDAWQSWWEQNSPYLFYSELGCYRWYIDPLARKRGVPTKDLRGPARADVR